MQKWNRHDMIHHHRCRRTYEQPVLHSTLSYHSHGHPCQQPIQSAKRGTKGMHVGRAEKGCYRVVDQGEGGDGSCNVEEGKYGTSGHSARARTIVKV